MLTPQTIRAITLDFWNTLFRDQPATDERRAGLRIDAVGRRLSALGYVFTEAELRAAHKLAGARHVAIQREGRDVSALVQVGFMLEGLRPGLMQELTHDDQAAIVEAYGASTLAVPPEPLASDLAGLLTALRGQGWRIGLISNTGRTPGAVLRVVLEQAGVLAHFDHLTFSDEIGLAKPNPAIFAATLAALDAAPQAAVHVGDDFMLDVGGAQRAGMRTIQVHPAPAPADGEPPDRWIRTLDELPAALEGIAR
jgi:putative hydrolase of the HAD superfamily